MQVPASEWAASLPAPLAAATLTARVERGDLAALPIGELLQAVVVKVERGAATLLVQGRELVIRPSEPMQPGTVWLLRRPPGEAGQQVEYLASAASSSPPGPPGHTVRPLTSVNRAGTPAEAPQLSGNPSPLPPAWTTMVSAHSARPQLVEVQEQVSPQTYRIAWLGQTMVARSEQPLLPQHQHLVQFELRPDGLWLIRPAETSQTPRLLAAALLSQLPPADLAPALADLSQTLTGRTFAAPSSPASEGAAPEHAGPPADTTSHLLRDIRAALESFWPSELRPLTAQQLRHLVENGGLLYESRLASALSNSPPPTDTRPVSPGTPGNIPDAPLQAPAPNPEHGTLRSPRVPHDLKGSLLQLVQSLVGSRESPLQTAALPALQTLQSIVSLQAANILASHQGTSYWLQVPFPDGSAWRTLYMALQPEFPLSLEDPAHQNRSSLSSTSQRFHVLIHAPLDTMGSTWIDMTLHGDRLHAVLYFEREAALQQALALQGELHQMLQDSDFTQIGVEFRSAADLPARHRQHAEAMRQVRPPSLQLVDWEV